MDDLLNLFVNISNKLEVQTHAAIVALGDPLLALAAVLGILSFSTTFEAYFSQTFMAANFIIKLIKVGMYMFFIRHWDSMLVMVKESAEWLGKTAGGADTFKTPFALIGEGVDSIFTTYGSLVSNMPSFWDSGATGSFTSLILCCIALGFALWGLFKIAFLLFMTNAEFLILGTLSMVLLPGALLRYTESIAEKTWGILLTCGVKVMVAVFMVCLVGNEITDMFNKLQATGEADAKTVAAFVLAAATLVFLSYMMGQAVEFAGAMTSGLTLQSGNLLRSTIGAGRTALGMPVRAYRYGRTGYRVMKGTYRGIKWTAQKAAAGARAAGRMAGAWWRYVSSGPN